MLIIMLNLMLKPNYVQPNYYIMLIIMLNIMLIIYYRLIRYQTILKHVLIYMY